MLNNHPCDLLPFYINGTLTEAEQTMIEAHVAVCPACQADLKEWQAIAQAVQAAAEDSAATLPPLKLPAPSTSRRIVPIAPLTSTKTLSEPENPSMMNHVHTPLLRIRYLRGSLALIAALILVLFGTFVLAQGIDGLFPSEESDPTAYHTGQATLLGQTGTPRPTLPTAYDVLQADPDLSGFAAAIAASGWLTNVTQSEPITIFVLPDRIFEPIQAEIASVIAEGSSDWEGYLFSYVVNDRWSRDQLADLPPEVRGYFERGGYSYGSKLQLGYDANGALLLNGMAHIAQSIEAANGYVHILDAPLVTARSFLTAYQGIDSIETAPMVCDVLADDPDYSYFKMVLDGLQSGNSSWIWHVVCRDMGLFTLFVPDNAAMRATFPNSGTVEDFRRLVFFTPEANEALQNFVLAHLLYGLWSQSQLAIEGTVRSSWGAEGHEFVNTVNARWSDTQPPTLIVNNRASVTKGDVIAANGIIHFVDTPVVSFLDLFPDEALTGVLAPPIETAPAGTPTELANALNELMVIADPAERQTRLDALWDDWQAAGQIPYVDGTTVAFLYRGEALAVEWRGDFNGWLADGALLGQNLSGTDLWIVVAEFPSSARLDYQIVVNGGTWLLDPANPRQQWSGNGPNSELRMPDSIPSEWTERREGVPQGTLSDPQTTVASMSGYALTYQVYTPANYGELDNLPVIYVLDGQDYADERLGALPIILDNLIAAGKIEPVIAVFVDVRASPNGSENVREEAYTNNAAFADFMQMLATSIDMEYSTDNRASRRLILGTSLGGQAALFTAIKNPTGLVEFGLVAAQSPSFDDPLLDLYRQEMTRPLNIWISVGTPEWDIDITALRTVIERRGYQLTTVQVNEGHSWGNWRGLLDDMLIHFFGIEERG